MKDRMEKLIDLMHQVQKCLRFSIHPEVSCDELSVHITFEEVFLEVAESLEAKVETVKTKYSEHPYEHSFVHEGVKFYHISDKENLYAEDIEEQADSRPDAD